MALIPSATRPWKIPTAMEFQKKSNADSTRIMGLQKKEESPENSRRSGNYHPTIWTHSLIAESVRSPYSVTDKARFMTPLEELKREAELLLERNQQPLTLLQTIDSMQRLGIDRHFRREIKGALEHYHATSSDDPSAACSCEEASLGFRLLRQHGYHASPGRMLSHFVDLMREVRHFSGHDITCLQAIYEASYHANYGESNLFKGVESTIFKHLKSVVGHLEGNLNKEVEHSLEMPFHWTMPRLEARRYIAVYEKKRHMNKALLELAKLDFNLVQSLHQRELMKLSRWWNDLKLAEKFPFSRDRLVENYVWAIGLAHEPNLSDCRMFMTKAICILTVIDDIYDVYGSLDELEIFTGVVQSWKLEDIIDLPEYMKPCFLVLYNFVDEVAQQILEVQRWDAKHLIQREWKHLCEGYLQEARWYKEGYKPNLDEYLGNAWITVGGPLAMVHAYLLGNRQIPYDLADCLELNRGRNLIFHSSLITRMCDDLGTSSVEMKRGDVVKSVQCYMEEACESEVNAEEYIRRILRELWMKLNEECHKSQLPEEFVNIVMNMARSAKCIYQFGDSIGTSNGVMKDRIISLFFKIVS